MTEHCKQSTNYEMTKEVEKEDLSPKHKIYKFLVYEPLIHGGNSKFYRNRWVRSVIYIASCLLLTLIYNNLEHFSTLLYKNKNYRHLCTDPADLAEPLQKPCSKQNNAMNTIYFIGLSVEFLFGLVAGVSIDNLGPLITGFVGFWMHYFGWICFLYCTPTLDLHFIGIILFAGSINMIAFPCLEISDYFPSYPGLAVSLIISAQTACTFVPTVMKYVWDAMGDNLTLGKLVTGFLTVVWLPLFILSMMVLPVERVGVTRARLQKFYSMQHLKPTLLETFLKIDYAKTLEVETEIADKHIDKLSIETDFALEKTKSCKDNESDTLLTLKQQLCFPEYILFTFLYVFQVLIGSFYPSIIRMNFDHKVSDFQGNFLPSQILWGTILGYIVGFTKTLPIYAFLVSLMIFSYTCVIVNTLAAQYASSMLYIITGSFLYTTKYSFVKELFPSAHYGLLVGLTGSIAGILILFDIYLTTFDYLTMSIILLSIGLICFILTIALWYSMKSGKTKKRIEKLVEANIESKKNKAINSALV